MVNMKKLNLVKIILLCAIGVLILLMVWGAVVFLNNNTGEISEEEWGQMEQERRYINCQPGPGLEQQARKICEQAEVRGYPYIIY